MTDETTLRAKALIDVLQGKAKPPPNVDWMAWLLAEGRADEMIDAALEEAAAEFEGDEGAA